MIKQAVILVGGKGERLYENYRFTPIDETPKPLVEVGGKPFLTCAINTLEAIGFTDIVLLVGYKKEIYEALKDMPIRCIETMPIVNNAIKSIDHLQDLFLLLNGDCYPIMNWKEFCNTDKPRVAMKINKRDAGVAVVKAEDVFENKVDCGQIKPMMNMYEKFLVEGGLHIGTYSGLQRARQYMDLVVFGE